MEILNDDTLLYLINVIKLDEDKNLTLMYLSHTNKYYHDLVKPLIEIDEVLLFDENNYYTLDIIFNRYNPYFIKLYRNEYFVCRIDPVFYKKRCIIINYESMLGERVPSMILKNIIQIY